MTTPSKTLVDLEKKFWQSMVDEDTDAALQMLNEPAPMVNAHGAMKWVRAGQQWKCVMHTETPAKGE